MIHVVGGIYKEYCVRPAWNETYGSGGRAASALATLGCEVEFHSVASAGDARQIEARGRHEGYKLSAEQIGTSTGFKYLHPLSPPIISEAIGPFPELRVSADKVLLYGFIELQPEIHGKWVVYDPQNVENPSAFGAKGSTAEHLALVLNQSELRLLANSDEGNEEVLMQKVAASSNAEVVVLKKGANGYTILENGRFSTGHAFQTKKVWKIGSGDVFAAHFAYWWMEGKLQAGNAAQKASLATAYYCEKKAFPTLDKLNTYAPSPLCLDQLETTPIIYLAGPFFTLAQVWLVNEMRELLQDAGFDVFSPLHDVGIGSAEQVVKKDLDGIHKCDLMISIMDGCDPGTVYEIGYAKALEKPVIVYAENVSEENLKMVEGSGCVVTSDLSTSIYQSVWMAWAQKKQQS